MERVLGIDEHGHRDEVRTEVIDLAIKPWLAGMTISAVQLSVGEVEPRRSKALRRR